MRHLPAILLILLPAAPLFAQAGDRGDKNQPEVWKSMNVPPAPVVPPEKAVDTFKLAPGFRIELVAAEPMVQHPVAIAWDADGRLWVVEMRGYMPNVDGKGEDIRNGRVSVLEDLDGDGKMDKSTVFLDGLQMPRAIAMVEGGVLVAEPPVLWYCRDTDGDFKCDEKVEAFKGYATQGPVEHTENGLLRNLDNWLYNAKSSKRMKFSLEAGKPKMVVEENAGRGQWGITQDNFGRLYHNSNSSYLSMDTTPPEYLRRNPNYILKTGRSIASDQAVWSIRVNPGVNRGYQGNTLRPDGRLRSTTATCGPGVYRGDQFPRSYVGHLFIPEPAGNVVSHFAIEETDGSVKAKHTTYPDDKWQQREFIASTDERFRPVHTHTGPDGCLYVVDLYHGILQHRVYVTSFLRKQILERGLDQPLHLGRIYRVVHESTKPGWKATPPKLASASTADLVKALSHPNGWWRDTAQRLLIERRDKAAHSPLREIASEGADPLARLHAMWTLDGLGALDAYTLSQAVPANDAKVKTQAIRLSEKPLNEKHAPGSEGEQEQGELIGAVLAEMTSKSNEVQRQLAFTLAGVRQQRAAEAARKLLLEHVGKAEIREAILSGLHGRELEFLQRLVADDAWSKADGGKQAMIRELAGCVVREGSKERIARLLNVAAQQAPGLAEDKLDATLWQTHAILDGIAAVAFPQGRPLKPLYYDTQPKAMLDLAAAKDKATADRVRKVSDFVKFGAPPAPTNPPTPLTEAQQKQFDLGKVLFSQTCAACHQLTGLGEEGKAPPLIDSPFLLGSPQRTVRIVLHGVTGPIKVHGREYNMEMPPLKGFTDEQIAAILTYARREWEHAGEPVETATVTKIREATKEREAAWTEKELLEIK